MGAFEDAVENITIAAAEGFLWNFDSDVLYLLRSRQPHEAFVNKDALMDDLELILDVVLHLSFVSEKMESAMNERIDVECTNYAESKAIIDDYGFTESLEAANSLCCNFNDTNENQIAACVLSCNLPDRERIKEVLLERMPTTKLFNQLFGTVEEENNVE